MKIVLDTNIMISALLIPKSNAGRILKYWQENKFEIVISSFILQEIERVLHYPKIKKRLNWGDEKIKQYLKLFSFYTQHIDIQDISIKVEKDHNDAPILATFLAAQANYLITGDDDLLSLKEIYPAIITPAEFLKLFYKQI